MSIQSTTVNASGSNAPPRAPGAQEKSSMVFPLGEDGEEDLRGSPEYWDGRMGAQPKRTVRRKKSSFDLRDVFKKGAPVMRKSML